MTSTINIHPKPHPTTMRKTFITAALFSILGTTPLQAAFNYLPTDPRGTAMSGAMTAIADNPYGIFYNPASTRKTSAGLAYTIPYGDSSLDNTTGAVNLSLFPMDPLGHLSAGINRYHADSYKEETVVIGYARTIVPGFHTGFSVSRMTQKINGSEDDSATGLNAGLQAGLSSVVTFGISAMNLNSPTIGAAKTKLPRTTLTGLSFKLPTGPLLTINSLTDPDRSGRLLVAGDIPMLNSVHLLVGGATNPSLFSAGAELEVSMLKASIAFSHDTDLGTTSSFGVTFSL
ncbi:MAG: hypothetical protein HGA97_05295 [Chlorobiaceae bacterium]|nr:hypothetical protein [Chlorobiaceae bacterium]